MGWGGSKKKTVSSTAKVKRVTYYQVVKDGEIVAEYLDIVSARDKAVEINGRIQITAKNIEIV